MQWREKRLLGKRQCEVFAFTGGRCKTHCFVSETMCFTGTVRQFPRGLLLTDIPDYFPFGKMWHGFCGKENGVNAYKRPSGMTFNPLTLYWKGPKAEGPSF
jgi:hypothetical protein